MTTQRHELEAWLGDGWTPEQREQIIDEYTAWERRHPSDHADTDLAQAVLTAIAQRVDDVLDLDERGDILARARQAEADAMRDCRAAVIALDLVGEIGRGRRATEVDLAEWFGVNRGTVRSWRE